MARFTIRTEPENIKIKRIANQIGCRGDGGFGFRRHPAVAAGAGTDDQQTTLRVSRVVHDDRRWCQAKRAGRPGGFGLGDDQRPVRTDGGQCRPFRHAVTADFPENDIRRVFEARRLGFQRRSVKEPGSYAQTSRKRMNGRLIRLEVQRKHTGNRGGRDIGLHHCGVDQTGHFIRVDTALAADANSDACRVIDKVPSIAGFPLRRRGDPQGATEITRDVGIGNPARQRVVQPHGLARQQGSGERFHVVRVSQRPAVGRIVECRAEPHISGRGDGRHNPERCGNFRRETVSTAMTAQQRHDGRSVFRYCDHGGFRSLVGELRG